MEKSKNVPAENDRPSARIEESEKSAEKTEAEPMESSPPANRSFEAKSIAKGPVPTGKKRRYRDITRHILDPVILTDPSGEGRILWVNQAACEFLGWSEEELLKMPGRRSVIDVTDPRLASFLAERERVGWAREELTYIRKDGTKIKSEVTSSLFYDKTGRLRAVTVIRDIMERKRVEEELIRQKKSAERNLLQLSAIVENMNEGLFVVDPQGNIILVNRAMLTLAGLKEMPTENLREYMKRLESYDSQGRTIPREEWVVSRALRGESVHDKEHFIRRLDTGRSYTALFSGVPVVDQEGRVVLAILTVRDISERKKMEEELRASRDILEQRVRDRTAKLQESESRLRVLATELINAQENERKRIAHELHDSLAAQLAAIKYSLERRLSAPETLGKPAGILEIIKDVQNALVETRRIMANLRPSILDDIGVVPAISWFARETEKAYQGTTIAYSGAVQEREIPEALKIVVFRVVQESVTNAIRHGKAKTIRISLIRNGDWLCLTVEDNGVGFLSAEKKSPAGGMGLVSMQQRVESTGGIFSITSNLGEGTTVKGEWRINPPMFFAPQS